MDEVVRIEESFDYNATSGELYWSLSRPPHHFKTTGAYKVYLSRFAGKRAGCEVKVGNMTYRQVRLNNVLYMEHQVVWVIENGEFETMIDHFDGNGLNNKITNLRPVDRVLNGRNCAMKKNNTSGVTGVYWHKQNNNWVAEGHWTEDGINKKKSLGSYKDISDAKAARELWILECGNFTDRHGK